MLTWKDFPRKKNKIAIVGFADTTRDMVPWDDPDLEIFGVNEGYCFPWMKRWDRWMQIHPLWDLARDNNQNDPNHYLWLQNVEGPCLQCKGTLEVLPFGSKEKIPCPACNATGTYKPTNRDLNMPIYMQKSHPHIPGSVALPLKEIEDLMIPKGNNQRNYFTSSFAYIFGLVCLMGYPRVELYGFEMGAETEFHYQRANAEYLMGIAQGRGMDLYIPRQSTLLTGPFYAYRNMQMGYRQNLEMRKNFLHNQMTKEEAVLNTLIGEVKALKEAGLEEKSKAKEMEQAKQMSLVNGIRFATTEVTNLTSLYDHYFWVGTEGGDEEENPQYGAPPREQINRYVTVAYRAG